LIAILSCQRGHLAFDSETYAQSALTEHERECHVLYKKDPIPTLVPTSGRRAHLQYCDDVTPHVTAVKRSTAALIQSSNYAPTFLAYCDKPVNVCDIVRSISKWSSAAHGPSISTL